MGQTEHRAYKEMRNAQEKAKRNPSFSDYKEKVKEAEINWYKAQEEERKAIDGVKYICVNRSEKIIGYRFNHIITLENAHENPFFDEINNFIIPCLVSETI